MSTELSFARSHPVVVIAPFESHACRVGIWQDEDRDWEMEGGPGLDWTTIRALYPHAVFMTWQELTKRLGKPMDEWTGSEPVAIRKLERTL